VTTTVDLEPRALDLGRLPLRRVVGAQAVEGLVAADPRLEPLRAPDVVVEVDVTAARPDGRPGWARLSCRHALLGDRVASTAWAGGRVELAAYGVEHWQTELARAATVPAPVDAPEPPAEWAEVPLDVLLAAGEAIRAGRPDVLDEVVRRSGTTDPAGLRARLGRLHTAVAGRLLATVAARDGGTSRAGWTSWLLFGDGWRSLTPLRREGRPVVRLVPATPLRLGAEVAALVTLVRERP
jgi:hypothetical protein